MKSRITEEQTDLHTIVEDIAPKAALVDPTHSFHLKMQRGDQNDQMGGELWQFDRKIATFTATSEDHTISLFGPKDSGKRA